MTVKDSNKKPKQTVEDFVEKILQDKDVSSTDSEVRKQLKQDLVKRANDLINRRVIEQLNPQDTVEFENLLDKNPEEDQVQEFLKKKVKNVSQIVTSALLELRSMYMG